MYFFRFKGELKAAATGHISGPKRCMTPQEKADIRLPLLSKWQQFNCQSLKDYCGTSNKDANELLKKTFGDHYNIIIALIAPQDLEKATQELVEKCSYDAAGSFGTTVVFSNQV